MATRDSRYDTFHVEDGAIVDGFGAIVYDSEVLEDVTPECRQRLADLVTEHPDWDWMAASRVLVEEGLLEPF
jgi:hypothetical protein